ncbi:Ankyrin-3, partial [Stegodyphus mimosarum]
MNKRPWELSSAMLQAIQVDDVEAAAQILNTGFDVDTTVMHNKSAVNLCIERNAMKIAKLLIQKGCSLSSKVALGDSPLHLAVHTSDYALTKLLLENRADITSIDGLGQIPLHIACKRNSLDIVKLLLEKSTKSSLSKRDVDGATPLLVACRHSCPEIVKLLLSKGSIVCTRDRLGNGEILSATYNIAEYATRIIPMLLDAGALINQSNARGETALLMAITELSIHIQCQKHSYTDLCMLLINSGSDVNAVNYLGQTPLHLAVSSNNELLVRKLLVSGSNINCRDNLHFVPLFYACRNGNQRIVQLLVSCGAKLQAHNWEDCMTMFRNEETILLLSYLMYKSKQCHTLENLCSILIRKSLKNVEKDICQLPLPPSLIQHIQLKD